MTFDSTMITYNLLMIQEYYASRQHPADAQLRPPSLRLSRLSATSLRIVANLAR